MKNLVLFECSGPQLRALVCKIEHLFAPRSSRVIFTATTANATEDADQEETCVHLARSLSRIDLQKYADLYASSNQVRIRVEIESDVARDTAHRMPRVDWSAKRIELAPLLEKTKQTNVYSRIVVSGRQLRSAIVFCGERANVRHLIEREPQPTYHFQTLFRFSIAPAFLPLLLLECADQIVRVSKWSTGSSIYQFETKFGSLLELTPYGVSDATLFAYDPEKGFLAPYKSDPTDVPRALSSWEQHLHDECVRRDFERFFSHLP